MIMRAGRQKASHRQKEMKLKADSVGSVGSAKRVMRLVK